MNITDIINQIESDKESKHIHPTHALLIEIKNGANKHGITGVDDELSRLEKEGVIETGRTIRDTWFKLL